ncbi:hypothetical protein V6N13_123110 [Hibiscus sabdariffa]|uniref:Uncharacterized protein n=2 Tax=Hibiscus sabdariffa TaxID=183260 RepID=A0ABR2CZG2_9ROSI
MLAKGFETKTLAPPTPDLATEPGTWMCHSLLEILFHHIVLSRNQINIHLAQLPLEPPFWFGMHREEVWRVPNLLPQPPTFAAIRQSPTSCHREPNRGGHLQRATTVSPTDRFKVRRGTWQACCLLCLWSSDTPVVIPSK